VRGTIAANEGSPQAALEDRLDYAGKPVEKRRGDRLKAHRTQKYSTLGREALLFGMTGRRWPSLLVPGAQRKL
jgi:hypothetical protein